MMDIFKPWLGNLFRPAQPIYRPLGYHEIRLVVLQPGNWESAIKCELITRCLDDNPDYQALSYCWDPKNLRNISLEGQRFQVTQNLESALRRLRYEDRDRII